MAVDEMDSYQRLSRKSRFHNEDERLWWHSTAPMFSKLLETAKYDKTAQLGHLETFKKLIIPYLGVYPTQHGTRWLSVLTRHGLPFELSLNCSNSIVRYTYEPINQETATKEDHFNTKAIWSSLSLLKDMQPSIDLQWFTHFKKDLTLSEEESAIVGAGDISQYPIKTQNKLALDLKQNGFTVKCYIYPELKAIATGTSVQDLMFSSIQSLCKATPSIGPAFNALQEYIESHNTIAVAQDGTSLSPRLLSCDLVNPERSRIKVYFLQRMVSWAAIQDMWTLGGRCSSQSVLNGMKLLRELWDLLQIPPGLCEYPDAYLPLGAIPDEQLPCMANYTLHHDDPVPEPQVYFTVFGMQDHQVTTALTTFFERNGWHEMAAKYSQSLWDSYPQLDPGTVNYLHTYISFSYRANKPYVSVYLHSFESGHWSKIGPTV